uniref:Uncharacterized protein n=1 Tax=Manihot esculenta TaxID=3983 RepID=A0A2C9TZE3_MANES
MESVELKVEMVGIHEKRLRKSLSKLKGNAHRNKILRAIRRGGLKADFWSAQNDLLNAYAYGSLRFNNFNFF